MPPIAVCCIRERRLPRLRASPAMPATLPATPATPPVAPAIATCCSRDAAAAFRPRRLQPRHRCQLRPPSVLISSFSAFLHFLLPAAQKLHFGRAQQPEPLLWVIVGVARAADFAQEASYVDPCTPRGYLYNLESQTFSSGLINSKSKLRSSHAIGNFSKCRMAALKLLAKENEKCLDQHCRSGLKFIPKLEGRFFATENFFYTSKFFGLGETSALSDLILAGEKYCNEDWLQIKDEYDTYHEIVFTNQVGNVPLDWALGETSFTIKVGDI